MQPASKIEQNSKSRKPAIIIPSKKHALVKTKINRNALVVLQRLHQADCQAYLVGGSVRDLLLGIKPKDFDVATDVHPETVRRLFRNSRLIGRRFRLVHVFFGPEIVEVATFRAAHPEESHPEGIQSDSGMIIRDNIYGSIVEDAWRRDFSINALYYNIADESIVDYTGGMVDLEKKLIRILGDAEQRYREDPVRMLRAVRLAAKLDFVLEPETAKPILELNQLIKLVAPARLFDEVLKLFYCGHGMRAFRMLCHYEFFTLLFPQCDFLFTQESSDKDPYISLILHSCKNTDMRIKQELSLNPAFLFAVLLWPALQRKVQRYQAEGEKFYQAWQQAAQNILSEQARSTAIPKRFSAMTQEIWQLQSSLLLRPRHNIQSIFTSLRFRAAFDFLVLRFESGETQLKNAVEWWQEFQILDPEGREAKIAQLERTKKKRKRKSRKKIKRPEEGQ
ncbi:MAG: polynucleotide adenylyltransferase PcnB [Gammaproteobacteria bacterium]